MTSFLLVRSIPLSKETRDAWRDNNIRIVARSKLNHRDISADIQRLRGRAILNMGNLDIDFSRISVPVFNSPKLIRAVSLSTNLRRTLKDTNLLPGQSHKVPHWHKRGGSHGQGKVFHEKLLGECAVMGGETQEHVEGTEYRVNTVGDMVVQAHVKNPLDRVGSFEWEWCGVDAIRKNGIIPLLKDAVDKVPDSEYSVLGWDVIVGPDRPYIIECNTSPGVNGPTAERIVNQIERILA